MSLRYIGSRFGINNPWGKQEHYIVNSIQQQIEKKFANENNLMLNMTWLGPQFGSDGPWGELQNLIAAQEKFDNLFWSSPVDPLYISFDQMKEIEGQLNPTRIFYTGINLHGKYEYNTGAIATMEDFPPYTVDQLEIKQIKHLYICYNRKPKPHRIVMVDKLYENNLQDHGIITLGKITDDRDYYTQGLTYKYLTINDPPENYTFNGRYRVFKDFGDVPYDISSLGRMDLWQGHFLNIVSETICLPWDPIFVTEKTWKPILGLRPFILNAQTTIYQWLRDRGFKTFNQYFNGIEVEDVKEFEVQDSIIKVVKYLTTLSNSELMAMYKDMMPALIHNRQRFFEFAKEQQYKIDHLFE